MLIELILVASYSFANGSEKCSQENNSISLVAKQCVQEALAQNTPEYLKVDSNEFEVKTAQGKKINPEEDLKNKMSHLTNEEIMVRLIFAETLASECPQASVTEGISQVIQSRFEKSKNKNSSGGGVVFEQFKFRSTTGSCDVAKRNEFLCPDLKNPLQKETWKNSIKSFQSAQNKSATNLLKPTHYFFFNAFNNSKDSCAKFKGVIPDWVSKLKPVDELNKTPECVKFYK